MIRWGLFLSLAVNLLLIGIIAGGGIAALRHQKTPAPEVFAPNMRSLMESLPPARAAEVRTRVVETWRGAQAERQAAREARLEVDRIASADPYDKAAAKAAFAKMRDADRAVSSRFQDAVAETMASMSVEERRMMLRQLAQRRLAQRLKRVRDFGLPPESAQPDQTSPTPSPPPTSPATP